MPLRQRFYSVYYSSIVIEAVLMCFVDLVYNIPPWVNTTELCQNKKLSVIVDFVDELVVKATTWHQHQSWKMPSWYSITNEYNTLVIQYNKRVQYPRDTV